MVKEAYIHGFIERCEELGVDPNSLLEKQARVFPWVKRYIMRPYQAATGSLTDRISGLNKRYSDLVGQRVSKNPSHIRLSDNIDTVDYDLFTARQKAKALEASAYDLSRPPVYYRSHFSDRADDILDAGRGTRLQEINDELNGLYDRIYEMRGSRAWLEKMRSNVAEGIYGKARGDHVYALLDKINRGRNARNTTILGRIHNARLT